MGGICSKQVTAVVTPAPEPKGPVGGYMGSTGETPEQRLAAEARRRAAAESAPAPVPAAAAVAAPARSTSVPEPLAAAPVASPTPQEAPPSASHEYDVSIAITADPKLALPDLWSPHLVVSIVGTDAEVESAPLGVGHAGWFRPGAVSGGHVVRHASPLGALLGISVELQHPTVLGLSAEFLARGTVEVDSITVTHNGTATVFPAYTVLAMGDRRCFLAGGASLACAHPRATALRAEELARAQRVYAWGPSPGLVVPGFVQTLPADEGFADLKTRSLVTKTLEGFLNQGAAELLTSLDSWDSLLDFDDLFATRGLPRPALASRWRDDAEFGRSFTQGVHPNRLTRCTALPPALANAPGVIAATGGLSVESLDAELSAGRLFLADYSALGAFLDPGTFAVSGAGTPQTYAPPAVVLLRSMPESRSLLPIAIKLDGRTADGAVFTPGDAEWDWLTAKTAAACADVQFHQVIAHYLETHATAESFAVAVKRHLSPSHPVAQLLQPHLKGTLVINTAARAVLINPGGILESLLSLQGRAGDWLSWAYGQWTPADASFSESLASRGLTDSAAAIPEFPYRDDGALLWGAIAEYVGAHLGVYYGSDGAVAADAELGAYYADLQANGHAARAASLPPKLDTIATLASHLTSLIWTVSCQHAAVNFGQYDCASYAPARPPRLRAPPPMEKGGCSEATLMAMLPAKATCLSYLSVMFDLSQFAPDEEYLGQRGQRWLHDPPAVAAFSAFQAALKAAEAAIDERNASRAVPYLYLKPSRVPASIAV